MFSRLPFRLSFMKTELNESFIKTRHMSVNKTGAAQHHNFILDVFELLELDFEEYSNTVRERGNSAHFHQKHGEISLK